MSKRIEALWQNMEFKNSKLSEDLFLQKKTKPKKHVVQETMQSSFFL